MPKSERLLLVAAAATSLLLRAVALVRYRFDSDEPQHLHVAWGWTQGLVQYRDLFDNHTPLFHIVTAPLVALAGERSEILIWMRVPMLALFAIVLWATWRIGRELYDERVAVWAVVLLSLFPPFFLKSLEYRTDNLWNALWMLSVLAVMRRRFFLAGLLLGAALAVSMKTILLVVTLLGGAALTFRRIEVAAIARAAAGLAIVPAILATYFVAVGAWDALMYCVVEFNGQVAATRPNAWIGRAVFPFALAAVLFVAWRWRRGDWRYFFAVGIGIFTVTLAGFWILISTRDFLPLMPLLAVFAAAALVTAADAPASTRGAVALVVLLLALYRYADRFENRTANYTTMIDQLLRVSRPGETIIDYKGELVFRRRATYPIFEAITRAQMLRGMIADTIAEDVVRTRTYVAQADGPMWPPLGRAFLSANFINLGRLRAAGQWIREDGTFTIAIPGDYVILSARAVGPVQRLAAGRHRYSRRERAAVVWAPAIHRGHSPFRLRDLDFQPNRSGTLRSAPPADRTGPRSTTLLDGKLPVADRDARRARGPGVRAHPIGHVRAARPRPRRRDREPRRERHHLPSAAARRSERDRTAPAGRRQDCGHRSDDELAVDVRGGAGEPPQDVPGQLLRRGAPAEAPSLPVPVIQAPRPLD